MKVLCSDSVKWPLSYCHVKLSLLGWLWSILSRGCPGAPRARTTEQQNHLVCVSSVTAGIFTPPFIPPPSTQGDTSRNSMSLMERVVRHCNINLPDGSCCSVPIRPGVSIREVLHGLCEKLSINLAAVDLFLVGGEKVWVDPFRSLSLKQSYGTVLCMSLCTELSQVCSVCFARYLIPQSFVRVGGHWSLLSGVWVCVACVCVCYLICHTPVFGRLHNWLTVCFCLCLFKASCAWPGLHDAVFTRPATRETHFVQVSPALPFQMYFPALN